MERFLFRKIELWVVLLIAVLGALAAFLYGWAVFHVEHGGSRFGRLTPVIKNVARAPTTLLELAERTGAPGRDLWAPEQRFEGQAGHVFAHAPGDWEDAPYLLLNRYDGGRARSVSELVDLNSQETVHIWVFEVDQAWQDHPPESRIVDVLANAGSARFRNFNAYPAPDGSLVTQSSSTPLIKAGLCGEIGWVEGSAMYHHSVERDAGGNYWVPAHLEPKQTDLGGPGYLDDAVMQVSPAGDLLWSKSVTQMMVENGLGVLLYGQGPSNDDPIHLNDIQPVLEDGRIWKRGDLLLSLRNKSMILLYRPETNEILWHRTGPWLHQHDVNITGDGMITVFDNAARLTGAQDWKIEGTSGMWEVNLIEDSLRPVSAAGFAALDIRTEVEGRGTLLPGGRVFAEETIYGRAAIFGPDGTPDWSFVNRSPADGKVYYLNWSRIVDRSTGDAIRQLVQKGPCPDE